jgi:hypothetical protein
MDLSCLFVAGALTYFVMSYSSVRDEAKKLQARQITETPAPATPFSAALQGKTKGAARSPRLLF